MKKQFEEVDEKDVSTVRDHEMQDGAIYTGQMKKVMEDGVEVFVKHGRGMQKWPDGAKYEGDWRDGMAQGRGTFHHANRDLYTGEFYMDRANGYGAYIHENGQRYEG
jgi:hypothetical protein